ncbi:MAG: hypothetical protein A2Z20_07490 [Bdellovibrionales bacterium RBG_16_40_8]|nr:MAG: hypothetical protein A2Z20_07490 [Bdellovibrionales bacterium RBG_16_40_8]
MKGILFLCVENHARSQMAEGLARHFLGHQNDIYSAGSKPAKRVHPMATAVMAEIGIDISGQYPKSIDTIDLSKIQLIVTLCADEECPKIPSKIRHERWAISDPSYNAKEQTNEQIRKFRKIRDSLRQLVLNLRAADQVW